MAIIVQKYGGTSLATPERIRHVASRIKKRIATGDQIVAVVSAMGKSTDQLLALAHEINQEPSERELDMLLTTGEQISISLLAMSLQSMGVSAVSMTGWQAGILTEPIHGSARIHEIDGAPIIEQLTAGKVVIVAGFQGFTSDGEITTLGRGGSDTTAVALAASLNAKQCEIYSDVTGVYTSDPRLVPLAQKLDEITYDEMLEYAHLGAGILHPRAVECGKKFDVPILVGSTFVEEIGTIIKGDQDMLLESKKVVIGVAYDDHVAKIKIEGLPNRSPILAQLFNELAAAHINVDIIIYSMMDAQTTDLSFSISEHDLAKTLRVLEQSKEKLAYRNVYSEVDLAKVSIIGSGMVSNHGVAAQMFSLLSDKNIDIKMVSTSEIKISTVIPREVGGEALQTLHTGFNLDKEEV